MIDYSEYNLLFILFLAGGVSGGVLPLRGGQVPPLPVIISNAILCGFLGIVGGGISSYFLPVQSNIIMLASGVCCSCSVSLFSNEVASNYINRYKDIAIQEMNSGVE